MFDPKRVSKPGRQFWMPPAARSGEHRQYRLMMGALLLLLVALTLVLYRDRDFWFPDTDDADDAQLESLPVVASSSSTPSRKPEVAAQNPAAIQNKAKPVRPGVQKHGVQQKVAPVADPADASDPPPVSISERTVLPPLEVEVVAGDVHKTVHVESSNALHVDLQPNAPPPPVVDAPTAPQPDDTAAGITANVAERVQMSADSDAVISRSVEPAYPLLARQMKVQGSVILQAFINRDGSIDDLHVLSGPPILANAAQEAVKQWHFKPHYQGQDMVETQAKITVNFTISTN